MPDLYQRLLDAFYGANSPPEDDKGFAPLKKPYVASPIPAYDNPAANAPPVVMPQFPQRPTGYDPPSRPGQQLATGSKVGMLLGGGNNPGTPLTPPSIPGPIFGSRVDPPDKVVTPDEDREPSIGRGMMGFREPDGASTDAPPKPNIPTTGGDGRPVVMQAGDRAGLLSGLGNVGNWLSDNSDKLLAISAGMAGAPSFHAGVSRAAGYLIPASEQERKRQQETVGQTATYNALLGAGVPRDLAVAGATNPKVMDKLLDNYLTGNKMEIKTVKQKNSWGEETEQMIAVDPRDPTRTYNITTGQWTGAPPSGGQTVGTIVQGPNGSVMIPQTGAGGTAAPGGTGVGIPQKPSSFYAPGINDQNFDPTAVGPAYLAQFSPDVQARILDQVQGFQPASQGRSAVQTHISQAAEKYGRDMGIPMDAAATGQRLKYARELTSEAGNTAGGKARALHQGLSHFVEMSDALVDMHLSGGMGVEKIAQGVNWMKSLSAEQQRKIARAQFVGGRLAGEMGTLNSASGGGVHERQETARLVSDAFQSRQHAAGALEGVVDIMQGGIDALVAQRDGLFPPNAGVPPPKGSDFMTKKEYAQLEHIRRNIEKLGGKKSGLPDEGATATAPSGPGTFDYDPATGGFKQR